MMQTARWCRNICGPKSEFDQYLEAEVWLRFRSWCYLKAISQAELNPRVRCALGNVLGWQTGAWKEFLILIYSIPFCLLYIVSLSFCLWAFFSAVNITDICRKPRLHLFALLFKRSNENTNELRLVFYFLREMPKKEKKKGRWQNKQTSNLQL